jgi:hypothetical protein
VPTFTWGLVRSNLPLAMVIPHEYQAAFWLTIDSATFFGASA